jgi:hypothetical protein
MTATFSATVMVHSCVGVGLTAGHFVPRLRGNDEELGNAGDICVIPEIIAALIFVRRVIWHVFRLWF